MARIVPSNTVPGAPSVPAKAPASIPATLPTLMYDVVTAQSSGEQVFRADAFKNTTGMPIEVHSMRVLLEYVNPGVAPAATSLRVDAGAVIALRIALGGSQITRGYVPTWNICRSNNRTETYMGNGLYAYTIAFTHPIPLAPGASLSVQAKHLGFTPASIRVGISFAGKRGTGLQSPRRLPYVVYWQSPTFAYTQAAVYTTPPSVLVNDSGRAFNVDRIIGRFAAFSPTHNGAAWSATARIFSDFNDPTSQGVTSASLRLSMAQDRPVLSEFTQWRALFGQTGAIETDFIMRPNDYMVADVQHVAGPATLGTNPPPFFQANAGISLVGWRDF